jgi:hypothetical protein
MDKPQKAQAPTGSGVSTKPVMVDRKMASKVHAWGSTAAGHGTRNFMARPTATEMIAGTIFAPFQTKPPPVGGAAAVSADAATTTPLREAQAPTALTAVGLRFRVEDLGFRDKNLWV